MARAAYVGDLAPETSYREAASRVLAVRAEEVFAHEADVLDTADIERVHAMRVATRRLRAALEIFAPCLPRKRHRAALRDVKALADALGERRDRDVALRDLETFSAAVPPPERPGVGVLVARLRAEQVAANLGLAEALDTAHASDLRGRLQELADRAETPA